MRKLENVTIIQTDRDKAPRIGTMRGRGHQILDDIANEIAKKDLTLRGLLVVAVYRDKNTGNRFSADMVCENSHEIISAVDQLAFKMKLDAWEHKD